MHRETWPNLIVFSHLRWNFVYQRPQHLLSRAARDRNVFYFEEATFEDVGDAYLEEQLTREGVRVLVPRLPRDTEPARLDGILRRLLDDYVSARVPGDFVLWYYTPMALVFSRHLAARAVIYDCMDELSAFRFAPPALMELERELLGRADLVFTGGRSLYEVKRNLHPNVHAFPSSIDYAHFARARGSLNEPGDQSGVPRPRVGYFGVIDERLDYELLAGLARERPGWQFVMIGPLAKVSPEVLPRRSNIHYLGIKPYVELPSYLRG